MTALAAALALALSGLPWPGAAADSVVLQLHGPAQFEFAGYYAALWKGFYRDAGLAVDIHPGGLNGKTPIDPERLDSDGSPNEIVGRNGDALAATDDVPSCGAGKSVC